MENQAGGRRGEPDREALNLDGGAFLSRQSLLRRFARRDGPRARNASRHRAPVHYAESLLQDNHSWKDFERIKDLVSTVAAYTTPPPMQILDSFSIHANPDDRYRMLLLAHYYLLSRPETYFGPLSDNGAGTNVNDPTSDWNPYRWFAAMGTDIGQPTVPQGAA